MKKQKIKDFDDYSNWDEYEGLDYGSGASAKIWLQNQITRETVLFKYPKSENTTDHFSESVAFQIAKTINLPCAEYYIGYYKGIMGSVSLNFIDQNYLIPISSYIYKKYPDYNAETLLTDGGLYYSLEMLEDILDRNDFIEALRIFIFDFLIGNSDRHSDNWGFLATADNNDSKRVIAPLYDNSSSLCFNIDDKAAAVFFLAMIKTD